MSSYSGLERSIARVLGRFPAVKQFVKSAYSRLVYLRARKPYRKNAAAELERFGPENYESFFGYYDKSPANSKGEVLANVPDADTSKLPSAEQSAQLLVLSATNDQLFSIPVQAYNWQQGCRAHWLTDDLFIFNDFDREERHYVSRVYSLAERRQIRRFAYPVQDSFGTDYFLSLNYRRLMALRPDYGYRNLPALTTSELSDLKSDGVWRVDYESGKARLLVSLKDACELGSKPEFAQAVHKFNHVMISPSGSRFIVMHRYFLGQRRFDRLLLVDAETGNLKLLSDHGMVSHCFWIDDETVLGYMRGPGDEDGYWLINTESGSFAAFEHEKLSGYGDGHPHVNGDWLVTDTYPDKARMQHLLLCNWKTGDVRELGEFYHGFVFSGESRCDLHPRLSPDGRSVFFDSVFSGKRHLYRMDIRL